MATSAAALNWPSPPTTTWNWWACSLAATQPACTRSARTSPSGPPRSWPPIPTTSTCSCSPAARPPTCPSRPRQPLRSTTWSTPSTPTPTSRRTSPPSTRWPARRGTWPSSRWAGIRACSRSRAFTPTPSCPTAPTTPSGAAASPRGTPMPSAAFPAWWTPASTRCPCPRRWMPCAPAPTRS